MENAQIENMQQKIGRGRPRKRDEDKITFDTKKYNREYQQHQIMFCDVCQIHVNKYAHNRHIQTQKHLKKKKIIESNIPT